MIFFVSFGQLKRDTDAIRGPYNANRQSRYVELLLVVDHEEYKALGDLKDVYQHCKDITNIINAVSVANVKTAYLPSVR